MIHRSFQHHCWLAQVGVWALLLPLLVGCGRPDSSQELTQAQPLICPPAANPAALSYQQLRTGLVETIMQDMFPDDLPPGQEWYSATFDPESAAITSYMAPFQGQPVTSWQGWVVRVEPDQQTQTASVAIDMDEFGSVDDHLVLSSGNEGVRRVGFADVIAINIPIDQTDHITAGQKILFSGKIQALKYFEDEDKQIDYSTYSLALMIDQGEITPFTPEMIQRCALPETITLTLTRPLCSMMSDDCYTYHLVIESTGKVIYKSRQWASPEPMIRKEAQITQEQFKALLLAYEQADYDALRDDYEIDASDSSDATTSITTPTMRKSIYHSHGNLESPPKLRELEDTIDAIVNTAQFK